MKVLGWPSVLLKFTNVLSEWIIQFHMSAGLTVSAPGDLFLSDTIPFPLKARSGSHHLTGGDV